jgi:hypothetical protein
MADPELPCSGCAHSAAGVEYPGHPSGERPCAFCIRNPWTGDDGHPEPHEFVPSGENRIYLGEEQDDEACKTCRDSRRHPVHGVWYDGSPAVKVPMDCYHSLDFKNQIRSWGQE